MQDRIIEEMPVGYALYQFGLDSNGQPDDYCFIDMNDRFVEMTGLKKSESIGRCAKEVMPEMAADPFDWVGTYAKVAFLDKKIQFEQYVLPLRKWFRVHAFSPEKGYFAILIDDITEAKALEEQQIEIQEACTQQDVDNQEWRQISSAFEHHQAVMLFIEPETGRILFANAAAASFYGYSPATLMEMSIQELNMLDDFDYRVLQKTDPAEHRAFTTMPHRLKSGDIRMVNVFSSEIEYHQNKVIFSIIFDVTDKEDATREIQYLAYHDYLTGLYNRRYFDESFSRLNTAANRPLAIIIGDINGLKMINDNYGHTMGDELIRAAVDHIQAMIGGDVILSRIGGDEFAIMLTRSSESSVLRLTNRLEEALEKHIDIEKHGRARVYLSVSFGYGIQDERTHSLDELSKVAEDHIYRRKSYNERSMRSHMTGAMMNSLFQKSEREEKHSQRVSKYCRAITQALDFDLERINRTTVAGRLHDIGKIGIGEAILNKPGPLDAVEWELMKQHPLKSAKILENTEEYAEIARIVTAHHERWDGQGYPFGLREEQIPIEARIIAVADAFDAMTIQRTYRDAMTREDAIAELLCCSGTQFDPEIVDVFVRQVLVNKIHTHS